MRLVFRLVAASVNDLVEHVSIVTAETRDFLFQSDPSLSHEVSVTTIPALVLDGRGFQPPGRSAK
jgi:hypothetical protein